MIKLLKQLSLTTSCEVIISAVIFLHFFRSAASAYLFIYFLLPHTHTRCLSCDLLPVRFERALFRLPGYIVSEPLSFAPNMLFSTSD